MHRFLLLIIAFAGIAAADTLIFTISGTGAGTWGSQTFTNAAFTLTFASDTSSILQGTPCCAGALTTPAGTPGTVSVAGLGNGTVSGGDQAIFENQSESTAGIWHYNSPDYLTIGNPAFSTYDLTTNIGPVDGTTFSFATPITAAPFGGLYFTSVSGVTFTAQRASGGGTPALVSVSPSSGTTSAGATDPLTFVVSDPAGVSDLQGIDILISDPGQAGPADPYACWMFYQVSTNTLTTYLQGQWTNSGPIGGAGQGGANLAGDECSVNTSAATVSTSGNYLMLNLPIAFQPKNNTPQPSPATWQIYMLAANNENLDTGYRQMGTVTINPTNQPGFTLSISPTAPQGIAIGTGKTSIAYTLTVSPFGGFNDTVTFTQASDSTPGEVVAAFNPPTVTGAGSTTVTASTTSASVPASYRTLLLANSPSYSDGIFVGPIYVASAPPTISIQPSPGTTASQVFTVTATDPASAGDINGVDVLFGSTLNGQQACWIFFGPDGLWLANDNASSWLYLGALGTAATVSNSQCTVGGTQGSASDNGNTRTLGIPITFSAGFAGTKTIFLSASNLAGFGSDYQASGTWNVP